MRDSHHSPPQAGEPTDDDPWDEGFSLDDPVTEEVGVRRLIQIVLGVVLVIAGIGMMVVPGPGVVSILVGLNMIKPDNRLARWVRRKAPGIPNEGPIPRRQIVIGVLITIAFVVFSMLYGAELTQWFLDLIGLDISVPGVAQT